MLQVREEQAADSMLRSSQLSLLAGFKLSSLNKIADTKSSTDSNMNLMHYLLQTLETKVPPVIPGPVFTLH